MVLICNNNVLSIDQFHKNRCEEKKAVKQIIIERKYAKEKDVDIESPKQQPNSSYSKSIHNYNETNTEHNKLFLINCKRR
jgi:hypothetical protein